MVFWTATDRINRPQRTAPKTAMNHNGQQRIAKETPMNWNRPRHTTLDHNRLKQKATKTTTDHNGPQRTATDCTRLHKHPQARRENFTRADFPRKNLTRTMCTRPKEKLKTDWDFCIVTYFCNLIFYIWDSSSWDEMRRDQYLEYKRGLNMNIPALLCIYFMMYNILTTISWPEYLDCNIMTAISLQQYLG